MAATFLEDYKYVMKRITTDPGWQLPSWRIDYRRATRVGDVGDGNCAQFPSLIPFSQLVVNEAVRLGRQTLSR